VNPPYPGAPAGAPPPTGMYGPIGTPSTSLSHQDRAFAQYQSSAMFGQQAAGAMGNLPIQALTAASTASMLFAPVMQAPGQSAGMRVAGRAFGMLDPFSYITPAFNAGYGGGMMSRGLSAGTSMTGAFGTGARAAAIRGALPRAIGLGLGASILPAAAIYAGVSAVSAAGEQFYAGAESNVMGQGALSRAGLPDMGQDRLARGGTQVGATMRDMRRGLGVSMDELAGITDQLTDMRLFQTTSTVEEFQSKFREVLGAVKKIAEVTQTTIQEATDLFGNLRQQGFYTTADVQAQALQMGARRDSSGVSFEQQAAIGSMGAQTARAFGMRGRVGANLFNESVSSVARGLRDGTMSEEIVGEMGGTEAAGMRLAQQQMGFLSSARGRMMIANSLGSGTDLDGRRLGSIMDGRGLESLVTGAAGRGVGVLQNAGSRKARENFAPYAGMAMVQTAMAQARQLHGEVTPQGLFTMLGTMGIDQDSATLLMQQQLNLPDQVSAQMASQQVLRDQSAWADLSKDYTLTQWLNEGSRFVDQSAASMFGFEDLASAGAFMGSRFQRMRQQTGEFLYGGRTFTGGGSRNRQIGGEYAMQQTARQAALSAGTGINFSAAQTRARYGLFAPPTAVARLQDALPHDMVISAEQAKLEMATNESAARSDYVFFDGGQAARVRDVQRVIAAGRNSKAGEGSLTEGEQASLEVAVMAGDLRRRYDRASIGSVAFTRAFGYTQDDFSSYFLAKESGRIGRGMKFDQYMKQSVETRVQTQRAMGEFLRSQDSPAVRGIMSGDGLDGTLMNLGLLETERANFQSRMTDFIAGSPKQGSFSHLLLAGPAAWLSGIVDPSKGRLSASGAGLARDVDQSGDARAAYFDFMEAATAEDRDSDEGVLKLQSTMRRAKEHLSEEGWSEVQRIFRETKNRKARAQRRDRWRAAGSGGRALIGRRELAEAAVSEFEAIRQAVDRTATDELPGMTDRLKKHIVKTRRAAQDRNIGALRSGASDTFREVLDDMRVDDSEVELLDTALGQTQGSSLRNILKMLTSGREERRKKALDILGVQEGQREAALAGLRSADGNERNQAVMRAVTEGRAGSLLPGFLGGKRKSIEGVQTEYVEANRLFVQTVQRFASAVGEALGDKGLSEMADRIKSEGGYAIGGG